MMKKFALLVCLALVAFFAAVPALAGTGGQGNVNVTTDTTCPGTVGSVNQITSADAINLWLSGSTPTTDSLTWTLTNNGEVVNGYEDVTLTYVCTDANTGFELWTTGISGGALLTNTGPGNKTSESYTIAVYDTTTSSTVGGDSFRRV
jgi:hypothetical protein